MGNVWFTADWHCYHSNIIIYTNRPWLQEGDLDEHGVWASRAIKLQRAEEMTEALIQRHNELVAPGDTVYFMGDLVFWKGSDAIKKATELAGRFNGQIHWILGNHDKSVRRANGFAWTGERKHVRIDEWDMMLDHYAGRVWDRSHHGTWQLHGHSHGSLSSDPRLLQMDVGIDCHDYRPFSFEEVRDAMKRKFVERRNLGLKHTHHGRDLTHSVEQGQILSPDGDDRPVIYLDMDGVCCCLTQAVYELFHSDGKYEELYNNWPILEYDVAKVLGISCEQELWSRIDEAGMDLWRNLPEFPWFWEMYQGLSKLGRVVFLTSPSCHWSSMAGKKLWLEDRFGFRFRDFVITQRKFWLGWPNRVLIDDDPRKVRTFTEAGGEAVLFPQPWNGNKVPENVADYIVDEVRKKLFNAVGV